MTYYGAKELAASFRTVRDNTIKIAEEIPEEHYSFQATPASRTVAATLAHIALGSRLQEQVQFEQRLSTLNGFDFFAFMGGVMAEEAKPRTKAELIQMLRDSGEKYAALLEGATEEFLAEQVEYPAGMVPPFKSRFEMVMSTKEHEMHHRGQLMLIERLLGQTPHLTRHMQERIAQMKAAQAGN
jgi:uncharacterized damage-inducible protein DinB